jgi:hypothetical protein
MKIKKYLTASLLILLVVSMSGCKKFLDVETKATVREESLFKNEQGFQDALNGVYLNMGSTALYGRELSYGYVDALAGMYVETAMSGSYLPVFKNAYTDGTSQAFTTRIWLAAYNNIANLNNIITKLETVNPSLFQGNNYSVVKGEALGLRAMLHF